jgi:hypothetical protein
MDNDTLMEFLEGRVLPTRLMHHMQYQVDVDEVTAGVILDCPEDAITCVILPTFVKDILHMEVHTFVDGERVDVLLTIPDTPNGCLELTLRRPDQPA